MSALQWGMALAAACTIAGCQSGCRDQRLPDAPPKSTPSQADLVAFHKQRAQALDSLISVTTAHWDNVVTTGTGIRFALLDRTAGRPAVDSLPEGTVLELYHDFRLLDGRVITTWQQDGPMAFECGTTDLPTGFHELICSAHLGDSVHALIPPSQAWGMSGRLPEIPQEAVIAVTLRIDRYTRPT